MENSPDHFRMGSHVLKLAVSDAQQQGRHLQQLLVLWILVPGINQDAVAGLETEVLSNIIYYYNAGEGPSQK